MESAGLEPGPVQDFCGEAGGASDETTDETERGKLKTQRVLQYSHVQRSGAAGKLQLAKRRGK